MKRIAWFITPHGRGHAARAAAIMSALRSRRQDFAFEIYTLVEETFFVESIGEGFNYHAVATDLGLIQDTPLEENVPATIEKLDEQLPYDEQLVASLATEIKAAGCVAVVCDIAPLGICVGREAGLPTVLVENFRWDWIYEGYLDAHPAIRDSVVYMRQLFGLVDFHIQTAPICDEKDCHFSSEVVSRKPLQTRAQTRAALGIGADALVVLVSGGVGPEGSLMERLAGVQGVHVLVSGFGDSTVNRETLTSLPYDSGYYHPDLVAASDAVVGKLGYSTVAEVYHAGLPYAYVTRDRFREAKILEAFVQREMACHHLDPNVYRSGDWVDMLPGLAVQPKTLRTLPNGADQVAEFLETRVPM
jgi:hypothetical protein